MVILGDDYVQDAVDAAFRSGCDGYKFKARGWDYDIDFGKMVQTNCSTRRERALRYTPRLVAASAPIPTLLVPVAPTPIVPPATAPASTPTKPTRPVKTAPPKPKRPSGKVRCFLKTKDLVLSQWRTPLKSS